MPAKEKVFYQSGNVRVTSTRFIVSDRIFAIASISSARRTAGKGSLRLAAIVLIFGLLFGAAGFIGRQSATSAFGLMLIAGAIWMFAARKTTHHVSLVTESGRVCALSSPNRHFIESVLLAIDEAMSALPRQAMESRPAAIEGGHDPGAPQTHAGMTRARPLTAAGAVKLDGQEVAG